jgi:hypothetical protein
MAQMQRTRRIGRYPFDDHLAALPRSAVAPCVAGFDHLDQRSRNRARRQAKVQKARARDLDTLDARHRALQPIAQLFGDLPWCALQLLGEHQRHVGRPVPV